MGNQNLKSAGEQVKAALDKIAQAKNDPQAMQAAINDAKSKVDQLCQTAEQGEQSQSGQSQQR